MSVELPYRKHNVSFIFCSVFFLFLHLHTQKLELTNNIAKILTCMF